MNDSKKIYFVQRLYNKNKEKFDENLKWGNFPVSRYLPKQQGLIHFDELLNKVPTGHVIMGIQYDDILDIQIGCSGTMKYGENHNDCIKRELEEEFGIQGEPKLISLTEFDAFFLLDIDDAQPINNFMAENKNQDFNGVKSWIIVHGNQKSTIAFMQTLNKLRRSKDPPYAVTAFKKENALKWVKYIKLTNSKDNWNIPINPNVAELNFDLISKKYVKFQSSNIEIRQLANSPNKFIVKNSTITLEAELNKDYKQQNYNQVKNIIVFKSSEGKQKNISKFELPKNFIKSFIN